MLVLKGLFGGSLRITLKDKIRNEKRREKEIINSKQFRKMTRFAKQSVGISCVLHLQYFGRIASRNGLAPFLSSDFLSLHLGFPTKIPRGKK